MAKAWAKAFYHSQAWQAKRAMALRRDGFTCRDCGSRATEVHHIIELTPNNINDVRVSLCEKNLVSLCHECHTRITDTVGTEAYAALPDGYGWNADGQIIPPVQISKLA
jgi:5-methylcytosine-specific restriction endonuclease McrA